MMNFSAKWSKRASIVEHLFIPAQNGVVTGVVEGPMHYGPGGNNASFQMARDTQHGSVVAGSETTTTPQRPKMLNVNDSPKLSHLSDFVSKNDLGDNDDGSLPCTPELDSEIDLSDCSVGDEVLEHDTRHLIGGFLTDFVCVSSQPRRKQSEAQSTMKRVVEDVIEKHRYLYNGMINKLELDERGDDMSFMSSVAKSLFSDGTTNWGRIASLVAFGAVVCQYLKKKDREQCVSLVGHEISTYLLNDQREWLIKNNSWDGFVDFFRVTDPESTVRNTLMAVAGFAGIGATLALLIR